MLFTGKNQAIMLMTYGEFSVFGSARIETHFKLWSDIQKINLHYQSILSKKCFKWKENDHGTVQVECKELKEVHGVWQRVWDMQCVEKEERKVGGSFFWQVLEVMVKIKTFCRRNHWSLKCFVQLMKWSKLFVIKNNK